MVGEFVGLFECFDNVFCDCVLLVFDVQNVLNQTLSASLKSASEIHIRDACSAIENLFKITIQPHYFTKKEFEDLRKQKNKLVEEILKDGISLF